MEKNRDYCFRHARMYDGWQCPLCLDEEERGKARPAAPQAQAPQAQARPAAAAPRPPAQEAARAESRTKSTQAEALLLSGSPREALDLCDVAIESDRRNLHAYLVGARASRVLRDTAGEDELLTHAIKLLQSEEYGKSSRWYVEVLKHLRDSRMVAQMVKIFVSANRWPASEVLDMVKTLVGRGLTSDALVVLDSLPAENRSLLTCAYSLQLSGLARPGIDPDLLRYLQSVPAAERARVLAEFYEVKGAEVLAAMTVSKVRDALKTRYTDWANDVKQLLSEEARRVAADRVAPRLNAPALSYGGRFLVGGIAVALVLALAGGAVGFLVGTVVALGAGAAGYAYGRDIELKRLLPTVLPEVKEELTAREVERWSPVLTEDPVDLPAADAAPPTVAQTCPFCNADIAADAVTCPHCQRPLTMEAEQPAPPEAPASPEDAHEEEPKPAESGTA